MLQYGTPSSVRFETLGADMATSLGTVLTANATPNTKGSWTTIGTSSITYEAMTLQVSKGSNAASRFLVDIAIDDGGGNMNVIAEDVMFQAGNAGAAVNSAGSFPLGVPIHVPSGSLIKARCQTTNGSTTVTFMLVGHSAGIEGIPGFSRMVPLTAFSSSLAVECSAGTTQHTKVRTELVASTPHSASALLWHMEPSVNSGFNETGFFIDLETGAASSEEVVVPNHPFSQGPCSGSSGVFSRLHYIVIPRAFPSGIRFSANVQSSAVNGAVRCALYALQ